MNPGRTKHRTKHGLKWTQREIQLLEELWGTCKLSTLAKKLGRSEEAILEKVKCIKLGPSKDADGRITANQLAGILNVSVSIVISYWIKKYGLKAIRKVTRSKLRFWFIDIRDFWKWAKKNQDKFDSRRFEPGALGREPEWMKQKRRDDMQLAPRRYKKWTPEEDEKLKALFRAGHLSYRQIAERLGRPKTAVQNRLKRIDIWGSGRRTG